jgi:hypothetical protein
MEVYNGVKLNHCNISDGSFKQNERNHEKYAPQTENLEYNSRIWTLKQDRYCMYKHNIEVRACKHSCSEKKQ